MQEVMRNYITVLNASVDLRASTTQTTDIREASKIREVFG